MLPSRYTQAVMAGESEKIFMQITCISINILKLFYFASSYFLGAAGFWVSVNRILTKSMVDDERGNTSMFFVLSILTIVMCFVLHQLVRKTEFVQFYITLCQERNRITLEPTEDIGLVQF